MSREEVNRTMSDNQPQTLTGYQLAKVVNAHLKELGFEKETPAQMVYSYIKQGLIPSVVVNGQNRVTEEAARTWVKKYVTRKQEQAKAVKITL